MTDEEMLEEYLKDVTRYLIEDTEGNIINITKKVREAFLAGLKAGKDTAETDLATIAYMQGAERYKPKWHKVADGDLPKDARYVWTNEGAGYHDNDGWWDDFGRLQNVIAWCEPKFEE